MSLHDKRQAILDRMEEQKEAIAHVVPDDAVEADTLHREWQTDGRHPSSEVGPVNDHDPQSALLLTETEWADLADILTSYTLLSTGLKDADIVRKRALATRIIEAAE